VTFLQSKIVGLGSNPGLEDQVPAFISPSDRVTQLHPQAPGFLSVAFYYSQGYGGGVPTRLHTMCMYKVSTMKLPEFIVHPVYNDRPLFCRCFKIGIFSGVKCLLRTTGVHIPTKMFGLPQGPPLERIDVAYAEVFRFFKLKLVCCVTDICR
jgi:hypothetical protein